jgi:acyl phosphate:glycerol-3-phosphate acyltransferase
LEGTLNFIVSAIFGYFIGSLPTAYLLLKKYHSIDITGTGSGNVGALNSYRVSRSKLTGLAVFVIDFTKGFLSVLIIKLIFGNEFLLLIASLISAVLAHCYSPWIKFKGGRGLATAAGGGVLISIPVISIWAAVWIVIFLVKKNVHVANIGAIVITILSVIISSVFSKIFLNTNNYNQQEFSFAVTLIMLIILLRHYSTLQQLIFSKIKNK